MKPAGGRTRGRPRTGGGPCEAQPSTRPRNGRGSEARLPGAGCVIRWAACSSRSAAPASARPARRSSRSRAPSEPASGPGGDPLERTDGCWSRAAERFPRDPGTLTGRPAGIAAARGRGDGSVSWRRHQASGRVAGDRETVMRARPAQGRPPAAGPRAHRAPGRSEPGRQPPRAAENGSTPAASDGPSPRRARLEPCRARECPAAHSRQVRARALLRPASRPRGCADRRGLKRGRLGRPWPGPPAVRQERWPAHSARRGWRRDVGRDDGARVSGEGGEPGAVDRGVRRHGPLPFRPQPDRAAATPGRARRRRRPCQGRVGRKASASDASGSSAGLAGGAAGVDAVACRARIGFGSGFTRDDPRSAGMQLETQNKASRAASADRMERLSIQREGGTARPRATSIWATPMASSQVSSRVIPLARRVWRSHRLKVLGGGPGAPG